MGSNLTGKETIDISALLEKLADRLRDFQNAANQVKLVFQAGERL